MSLRTLKYVKISRKRILIKRVRMFEKNHAYIVIIRKSDDVCPPGNTARHSIETLDVFHNHLYADSKNGYRPKRNRNGYNTLFCYSVVDNGFSGKRLKTVSRSLFFRSNRSSPRVRPANANKL